MAGEAASTVADRERETLRVCVLGLGGGGFHRQLEEILRLVRRPLEVVLIFCAPQGGIRSYELPHRIAATYVLRSPILWGDRPPLVAYHTLINAFKAVQILLQEAPDLILAVGSSQAIPFGVAGRRC